MVVFSVTDTCEVVQKEVLLVYSKATTGFESALLVLELFAEDIILVIEVLAKAVCVDVSDLRFEHGTYWIAFLLEYVQEEHQLILPFLAILDILLKGIDLFK